MDKPTREEQEKNLMSKDDLIDLSSYFRYWESHLTPRAFHELRCGIQKEQERLRGKRFFLTLIRVTHDYDGREGYCDWIEGFDHFKDAKACMEHEAEKLLNEQLHHPQYGVSPWHLVKKSTISPWAMEKRERVGQRVWPIDYIGFEVCDDSKFNQPSTLYGSTKESHFRLLEMSSACDVTDLFQYLGFLVYDAFSHPAYFLRKGEEAEKQCRTPSEYADYLERFEEAYRERLRIAAKQVAPSDPVGKPLLTCCRVSDVIRETFYLLQDLARSKTIVLQTTAIFELPEIKADERQLYRVLYHLIDGAITQMPEGGSITVGGWPDLRKNSLLLELTFSDIAGFADTTTELWRWWQVAVSVTEAHGGRATMQRQPKGGTILTFSFPIEGPPKDDAAAQQREADAIVGDCQRHPDGAVIGLLEALRFEHSRTSLRTRVRGNAAKQLGAMGAAARDAVPALIQALSDPDYCVRSQAAEALGEIGPEAHSAGAALTNLLKRDPEGLVRISVAEALRKIGQGRKG